MEQKYIHGIDLGTTNSCIAFVNENGMAEVVRDRNTNLNIVPSVVRYADDGEVALVGKGAKDTSPAYPNHTVSFAKRYIGQTGSMEYGEYKDKSVNPIDVSAEVLKKLAANASAAEEGADVIDVVITVPAYFNDVEKNATIEAGKRAGLNVIDLVEEPTAAALYYGGQSDRHETVLVYDLGGGTFDITAMKIDGTTYDILTTEGERLLGGGDWDRVLKELIVEKFKDETGTDLTEESDLAEVELKAEETKKQLTEMDAADVFLRVAGENAMFQVTKEEFDQRTSFLLDKTIDLTRKVYDKISGSNKVDKILLVGGSSRMRQVEERLSKEFPDVTVVLGDADEAVAKGAALFCLNQIVTKYPVMKDEDDDTTKETGEDEENTKETGEGKDSTVVVTVAGRKITVPKSVKPVNITSRTTKSLGVKILHNNIPAIMTLLAKDTQIPCSVVNEEVSLLYDNQEGFDLRIYQKPGDDEFYPADEEDTDDEEGFIGHVYVPLHTPNKSTDCAHVELQVREDGLIHAVGGLKGYPDEYVEVNIEKPSGLFESK